MIAPRSYKTFARNFAQVFGGSVSQPAKLRAIRGEQRSSLGFRPYLSQWVASS